MRASVPPGRDPEIWVAKIVEGGVAKRGAEKKYVPTTTEVEMAVARYFGTRINLVVPNVSWGLGIHECDLLVMTKAGYCYEVEIKRSKSDLIADKNKRHGHRDWRHKNRIRMLYFAITPNLIPHIEHVPEHAGIIVCHPNLVCEKIREARVQQAVPLGDLERFKLARLGALRIWTLKAKICKQQRRLKEAYDKGRP